jgi:Zn finger protein HypA/HybF involved in hydrogenase expression
VSKRKWTNQDLLDAVNSSENITEVMKKLRINHSSNNANTIKKYIENLNLSLTHWKNELKTTRAEFETPNEKVFCENSTFTKSHLREKIIKYNLIEYKCSICNMLPVWNDQILTLQVDHVNGINNDHRLVNLRFLCPNCHSQTNNYAGANTVNRKKQDKNKYICSNCFSYKSKVSKSGLCNKCFSSKDKYLWPEKDFFIESLKTKSPFQIAKELKVSATSLYKRLKKLNINYGGHIFKESGDTPSPKV